MIDWNRFTRDGDERLAFEAFAGQLFERWCRRVYGAALRDVHVGGGRGGDGGLDACASLASEDVVGLQAKWRLETLGKTQFDQIKKSLRRAIATQPRLVRYCIALPKALNVERKPKEKSEQKRWDEFCEEAKRIAPATQIELWAQPRLQELLSEPENEGLEAYWFPGGIATLEALRGRFGLQRAGWLGLEERYFPDLHRVGQLEADLGIRLASRDARRPLYRASLKITDELKAVRRDIVRLEGYPTFMATHAASKLRNEALQSLDRCLSAAEADAEALLVGTLQPPGATVEKADLDALHGLEVALYSLEKRRGSGRPAPTHAMYERLERCLRGPLREISTRPSWWRRLTPVVAYIGAPGVGKTHALARAVQTRLDEGRPALLIRAKDCPVGEGWEGILRWAMDWPIASLTKILNALEATAVRADVAHGQAASTDPDRLEREPTRVLLAVDGLEETGRHSAWADLLRALPEHLAPYPRIQVAVTLRTSSREAILGRSRTVIQEVPLAEGGDVQALLPLYCERFHIQPPDHRVRWAIRDPLSLRLYCQLKAEEPRWKPERRDLALPRLLESKLEHTESALRAALGFSAHDRPAHCVLEILTDSYVRSASALGRDALLSRACADMPQLSAETWSAVLDRMEGHGLLLVQTEAPGPLERPVAIVKPAFEPLTDYLIARRACAQIAEAQARGETTRLDAQLRSRPDALTQVAILLAQEQRISLVRSGLWKDDLAPEEIERLELRAIAALDRDAARDRERWVQERLCSSMPSCRRVLKELCTPVARDDSHPFGPRFVHEALLPLLPVTRDLFWSGPRSLHGDDGQPWAGDGELALEELTLEKTDAADGPPLLLAWALTSVDDRWRRDLRAALACWGAANLGELPRWLGLVLQTNDPQMAADATVVAFGAACLAGKDPRVTELARWVDENLLAPDGPLRRDDVAVLHAARGVVERAARTGPPIEPRRIQHARRLLVADDRLPPFDAHAARTASDHDGVHPITGDLAWYVVPSAIRGFFNPQESAVTTPTSSLEEATDELVSAARAGALGPLGDDLRRELDDEATRRAERARFWKHVAARLVDAWAPIEELPSQVSAAGASACDVNQDEAGDPSPEVTVVSRRLDPRVEAVLAQHAERAGIEALTPQRFAFGAIKAHLIEMGWNDEEDAEGGSRPLAAMDAAIWRDYGRATHGGRGPICGIAEKYVWTGCRRLGAYLGARTSFADEGERELAEPPVDPVLIAAIEPNPATDASLTDVDPVTSSGFWADDALVAPLPSQGGSQAERSVEWVTSAPEPPVIPWLLPRGAAVPHQVASGDDEAWVTLRCFVTATQEEAQADVTLEIWAAGVAEREVDLVIRDVERGYLPLRRLHLPQETICGAGSVDPSEAVWAPWLRRVEGVRNVTTLDERAKLRTVCMVAATAETDWAARRGGQEIWLPARWIGDAVDLLDAVPAGGGAVWRFVDRERRPHALYTTTSMAGEVQRALLIRRHALERALHRRGLTLVWFGSLRRAPSAERLSSLPKEQRGLHRTSTWVARLTEAVPTVTRATSDGAIVIHEERTVKRDAIPEQAEHAHPVPVGPVNPELAVPLSTDLDEGSVPYFLWDDPITVRELRRRLRISPPHERDRLLGKILREARDPDVWHFTTPTEVAGRFSALVRHLGRRRRFWEFLLDRWHKEGLLEQKPA